MDATSQAPRAAVRLPAALADYACARTLVCCKPPWRVYLGPHEDHVLLGRVARAGDRPLATRVRAAIERPALGVTLLTQPEEGCTLLDDHGAGCAVQRVAGLGALPASCRNFPRSVVRTPHGLEVAFLLQCPTAAAMVTLHPLPFTWVERDATTWPYDDRRAVAPRIWWDARASISFDALTALRHAWWARLAGDGADGPAPDPVRALFDAPDDPGAAPRHAPLAVPPPDDDVTSAEQRFLERLDVRGPTYRARSADVRTALAASPTADDLARAWNAAPHAFLCATGLSLQLAGVHATQPVRDAFRGAAWQTLMAVSLTSRIMDLGVSDTASAVQDALCATAHVSRWIAHTQAGIATA